MSKCFLFVEEEIILSAMCGNASFFVIWFAKRCFCAGVQYFWVARTGLLLACGRSCSLSRMVFFGRIRVGCLCTITLLYVCRSKL